MQVSLYIQIAAKFGEPFGEVGHLIVLYRKGRLAARMLAVTDSAREKILVAKKTTDYRVYGQESI